MDTVQSISVKLVALYAEGVGRNHSPSGLGYGYE